MSDESGVLHRHSTFTTRPIYPPAGFLPLSENIYSPRGSVLNSIILSHTIGRTRSVHDGEVSDGGTLPSTNLTTGIEGDVAAHHHHLPGSMVSGKIRSMRLIGNSNPRYRW